MSTDGAGLICDAHGLKVWRDSDPIQGLVHIRLNNGAKRNPQTPAMWQLLSEADSWWQPGDRFAVIEAEGPDFSAGLDREFFAPREDGLSLPQIAAQGAQALDTFIATAQRGFEALRRAPIVTIAAVQGNAIGAGFQLALACDLMLVHPDAKLRLAEVSWGIVPDLGGSSDVVASLGRARATQLLLGREISGRAAVEWGLAWESSDQLEQSLRNLLESFDRLSATALAHAAQLARTLVVSSDGLADERHAQLSLIFGQLKSS